MLFRSLTFSPNVSHAADVEAQQLAEKLNGMGLLLGSNGSFDLERAPTRLEASVMLLRLLGKEQAAKAANAGHPFTDVPAWGNPYVGYMYQNGMTSGIGNNLFGTMQTSTLQQYATFLLRALGFSDKGGDFTYAEAVKTAEGMNLVTAQQVQAATNNAFLRGDMVILSYQTLSATAKNGSTLMQQLVDAGAVSKEKAVQAALASTQASDPFVDSAGNTVQFLSLPVRPAGKGYEAVLDFSVLPAILQETSVRGSRISDKATPMSPEMVVRYLAISDVLRKQIKLGSTAPPSEDTVGLSSKYMVYRPFTDEKDLPYEMMAYLEIPVYTGTGGGTVNAKLVMFTREFMLEQIRVRDEYLAWQLPGLVEIPPAAVIETSLEVPVNSIPNGGARVQYGFKLDRKALPTSMQNYKYVLVSGTGGMTDYMSDFVWTFHRYETSELLQRMGCPNQEDIGYWRSGPDGPESAYFLFDESMKLLGYMVRN